MTDLEFYAFRDRARFFGKVSKLLNVKRDDLVPALEKLILRVKRDQCAIVRFQKELAELKNDSQQSRV